MYSGVVDLGVVVVGVADPGSDGWYSNADLNDISEMAVWGSPPEKRFEAIDALRQVLMTVLFRSSFSVLKGSFTSLATLITTSNCAASSAVGSRYRNTPVSYIRIGPLG